MPQTTRQASLHAPKVLCARSSRCSSAIAMRFAVAPQFWRVRNAEDFLAGDIEGFAVTSRGELRPGPSLKKVGDLHRSLRPVAGGRAERRSLLRHRQRREGLPPARHGAEGDLHRARAGDLRRRLPRRRALRRHARRTARSIASIRTTARRRSSSIRSRPTSGRWRSCRTAISPSPPASTESSSASRRKGRGRSSSTRPKRTSARSAVKNDGTILAGGSAKGRIYEIRPDGAAHALYDSPLIEISAIYVDANGIGWAAAASNVLPSTAPVEGDSRSRPRSRQPRLDHGRRGQRTEERRRRRQRRGQRLVRRQQRVGRVRRRGSGEIYRINPDGFVEIVRKFEHEMVYAITGGPNGSILLSTGPQGRIYELKDGEVSLLGSVPEKQVVSISTHRQRDADHDHEQRRRLPHGIRRRRRRRSSAPRRRTSSASRASATTASKATNVGDGHLAIAFRSGNTRTPDATWSPWSAASSVERRSDRRSRRHVTSSGR